MTGRATGPRDAARGGDADGTPGDRVEPGGVDGTEEASARLGFDGASRTMVGQVRAHNEDNCLVTPRLLAVADGMGGHAAGEVASAIAVEVLAKTTPDLTIESIVDLVADANSRILNAAIADPAKRGMGTTLCVAAVVQSHGREMLALANVGDSRIYALTDGTLHQLSEDHSLVETLVREGRITPEEATTHPQRNVLTRALGVDRDVLVDVWLLDPRPQDRFLLCSDGLFNEVDQSRIEQMLEESDSPRDAADVLAEAADDAGGRDNITVVVADLTGADGSPEALGSRLRWIGTSTSTADVDSPTSDDTATVPVVTPPRSVVTPPHRAGSAGTTESDGEMDADDDTETDLADTDRIDTRIDDTERTRSGRDPDLGATVDRTAARGDQMTVADGSPDGGRGGRTGRGDMPGGEPPADPPTDPPADPEAESLHEHRLHEHRLHKDRPQEDRLHEHRLYKDRLHEDRADEDGLGGDGPETDDPDGGGPRWRIVAFVVTIMLIVAIGLGALVVHERQGWTVRSRGNEVVLFKGRSESPPIIGNSDVTVIDDVPVDGLTEVVRRKLQIGERFETRSKAETYVESLRTATTTTSTTTTSSTTTTTIPTTATTSTPGAPPDQTGETEPAATEPREPKQDPPAPPSSRP